MEKSIYTNEKCMWTIREIYEFFNTKFSMLTPFKWRRRTRLRASSETENNFTRQSETINCELIDDSWHWSSPRRREPVEGQIECRDGID
jgi:hypothetical protein